MKFIIIAALGLACESALLPSCMQAAAQENEKPSGYFLVPPRSAMTQDGRASRGSRGEESKKFVLQGHVEHAERLPPSDSRLRTGASFSKDSLPTVEATSEWYWIPDWFAGAFRVESSTIWRVYDFRTGETSFPKLKVKSSGEETRGYQQDARGGIWQFSTTSGDSRSETPTHTTYNILHWFGPVDIGQDRVTMRVLATSVIVDKRTGRIAEVVRREDIKTYIPEGRHRVRVSYSSKGFAEDGSPKDMQFGFGVHKKIAPFSPIDAAHETDYRALFRSYLRSHGLSKLIPAG